MLKKKKKKLCLSVRLISLLKKSGAWSMNDLTSFQKARLALFSTEFRFEV